MSRDRLFVLNEPNALRIAPSLAEEIGLNESIVLLQIEFWISISDNVRDDKRWTYQSVRDMKEKAFPFWSIDTINRAVKSLIKKELLIEGNYNKKSYDKTRWFALGPGILELESVSCPQLEEDYRTTPSDNHTTPSDNHTTLYENRTPSTQNRTPSTQNRTTIPEITTENTTEISQRKNKTSQAPSFNGESESQDQKRTSKEGKGKPEPKFLEKKGKKQVAIERKSPTSSGQAIERVMSERSSKRKKTKKVKPEPPRTSKTMLAHFDKKFKEYLGGKAPLETKKDMSLLKKMIEHYEYEYVEKMIDWMFRNWAKFRRENKIKTVPTVGILWGWRAYLQDKVREPIEDEEEPGF